MVEARRSRVSSSDGVVKLRLYVAKGAPNSVQAERRLRDALARCGGAHELEVLDVFEQAARALEDGVLVTPMLIRLGPGPRLKIAGTYGSSDDLCRRLGFGEEGA